CRAGSARRARDADRQGRRRRERARRRANAIAQRDDPRPRREVTVIPRCTDLLFAIVFLFAAAYAHAQTAALRVDVISGGHAVPDASVVVNGVAHRTGADGVVSLSLPPGSINIVVVKEGLE